LLLAVCLLAACRPLEATGTGTAASPRSAPSEPVCKLTLAELEPDAAVAAAGFDWLHDASNRSFIAVRVETDLEPFANALAAAVPQRDAAAGLAIGAAGRVSYTAQRTPFSMSVRDRSVHFTSQISARAEVCKPLGLLGCVSYAQCEPSAVADASFGLEPDTRWWLGPSSVRVVLTRPCVVGPLDTTPMIQRGANQQAQALRRRIDPSVPSLRQQASALWTGSALALQAPSHTLRFHPESLQLGAPAVHGSTLAWPLSVSGALSPALPQPSAEPPAPVSDPRITPGVSVRVPIIIAAEALTRGLQESLRELPVAAGPHRAHVASVEVFLASDGIRLQLRLQGAMCGVIPMLASPALDESATRLRLSSVRVAMAARAGLSRLAPALELRGLEREVQRRVSLPVPLTRQQLEQAVAAALDAMPLKAASRIDAGPPAARLEGVVVAKEGLVVQALVEQPTVLVVR
jgi:hypothetical protein